MVILEELGYKSVKAKEGRLGGDKPYIYTMCRVFQREFPS